MTPFVERVFLGELEVQALSALAAIHQTKQHLAQRSGAHAIIGAIDDFIDHASRVSIILWPTSNIKNPQESGNVRRQSRGTHLREVLGIVRNHKLEDRKLRNHLQHFDERLDAWAESGEENYIDIVIGNAQQGISTGGRPLSVLRNFDPSSNRYIFRGDEFDIQDMVIGVEDILEKVQARQQALRQRPRSAT